MSEQPANTQQPEKPVPTRMRPASEHPAAGRQVPPISMDQRAARAARNVSRASVDWQPAAQQIDLHIDELVLHGFSRRDQARITEAIQVELRRLLGERRFTGDISAARLDGGSFTVRRGMRPEQVGIEVARAIMKGMG